MTTPNRRTDVNRQPGADAGPATSRGTGPGSVRSSTRWDPWPVSIIAFFTVAILGFGAFIWFCSRNSVDLVAADYYEQELRYQGQINRMRLARQEAAGASITYDPSAGNILVSLPLTAAGPQVTGKIELYRPSAAGLDRQFQLQPDAAGVHRIDTASLAAGLWQVRVSWTVGTKDFYLDRKVVIGAQSS